MQDTLVKYRTELGLAFGMLAATVTVVVFQVLLQLSSFVSVPAAILAYITAFVVWIRLINPHPGNRR